MVHRRPPQYGGFTLIELLVAIAIMALMAGLSWRGLDGMARAQSQISARSDALLTLQTGLAQWTADLDAILQIPGSEALDWDGRALRIPRRAPAEAGDGLIVVAWASRNVDGSVHWLRWQSDPIATRSQLQTVWAQAAQWGQNPSAADKRLEVMLTPLNEWRVFYYRADSWTNPLSSDISANDVSRTESPPGGPSAAVGPALALPDGVRVVLTLPEHGAVTGVITRDWIRPTLGGGKS